jgi:AcrR family transcriptional regulator
VLRAAVELADAHGIEALSMRRLAKELGVEAMSLYNHVANKDAILDGIVDVVVDEIDLSFDADWKDALRRAAISERDVLVRHGWASSLRTSRRTGGPAQLRKADWTLRTLREAGFSKELVYHAFHFLEAYVVGATVQRLNFPHEGEELARLAEGFLRDFPSDDYPDLAQHIREHLEPHPGESGFERGLDLILDGLERLRDA